MYKQTISGSNTVYLDKKTKELYTTYIIIKIYNIYHVV